MQSRLTDKVDEIVAEREKFVADVEVLKKFQIQKYNIYVEEQRIKQNYEVAYEIKALTAKL